MSTRTQVSGKIAVELATSKAYLISAHFNYEKWKALTDAEHDQARNAALDLFPVRSDLLPQVKGYRPLPQMQGVREVHTFDSDIFGRLPDGYPMLSRQEKIKILDPIYATQPPNPDVGWMAVVDANAAGAFMEWIGRKGGFLWRMFDVEVHPLSDGWTDSDVASKVPKLKDDQTTEDIYFGMTIRNWG